jgi:hypothetical protein
MLEVLIRNRRLTAAHLDRGMTRIARSQRVCGVGRNVRTGRTGPR